VPQYDAIGATYGVTRRTEPQIAAMVLDYLAGTRRQALYLVGEYVVVRVIGLAKRLVQSRTGMSDARRQPSLHHNGTKRGARWLSSIIVRIRVRKAGSPDCSVGGWWLPSGQSGPVAAEGEHGQGDEGGGVFEAVGDAGDEADLGVGGFDQGVGAGAGTPPGVRFLGICPRPGP
jgi:hypothetical protein